MTLNHLSSHALTARIGELLVTERETIVELLFHLAEVERRRLYVELGYSSMYAYCRDRLKLAKAAAFRRSTAARLITQYPLVAEYLRDGRLSLTTLCLLKDVLRDGDHRLVFCCVPAQIDLLASPSTTSAPQNVAGQMSSGPELDRVNHGAAVAAAEQLARARIEPVSSELRRMHVTVSREFIEDLEKVRALLSHSMAGAKLEEILHACIKKTIEVCEKRRAGSSKPRPRKVKTAPKG